jgi:hypothetical protein
MEPRLAHARVSDKQQGAAVATRSRGKDLLDCAQRLFAFEQRGAARFSVAWIVRAGLDTHAEKYMSKPAI